MCVALLCLCQWFSSHKSVGRVLVWWEMSKKLIFLFAHWWLHVLLHALCLSTGNCTYITFPVIAFRTIPNIVYMCNFGAILTGLCIVCYWSSLEVNVLVTYIHSLNYGLNVTDLWACSRLWAEYVWNFAHEWWHVPLGYKQKRLCEFEKCLPFWLKG